MNKPNQRRPLPKPSSQPSNRNSYTNQPLLRFATHERQLTLTKSLAPKDKDKVPFDGSIEEELRLYQYLFPLTYKAFLKFKSCPKLFCQNIHPKEYIKLIKSLYEGDLSPEDHYIAIIDLIVDLFLIL